MTDQVAKNTKDSTKTQRSGWERLGYRIVYLTVALFGAYYAYVGLGTVGRLLFPAHTTKTCVHVEGFGGCPYFQRSVQLAARLHADDPAAFGPPTVRERTRSEWGERLAAVHAAFPAAAAAKHRTSPAVWLSRCRADPPVSANLFPPYADHDAFKHSLFVGGNDAFQEWAKKRESAEKGLNI
ncbi:hypothetical protein HK100_005723 [Physocladia obscura]|uniref:Uncharacterized protein n=1 Tax=Physocladia obscura TaxID=109957 RepID=A0AAD5SX08_9FUNG|nr:hypothetical protein HK100_005723 [Physocladia obscura]